MRISLLFLCLLGVSDSFSQFTQIPTGTTTPIQNIIQCNDVVYISGRQNYFAKTTDGGITLIPLTVHSVAPFNGYSLNCIDSSELYVVSGWHNPAYQYKIKKSIDGGNFWNTLLDTSGFVILTMKMLDSSFGVAGSNLGTIIQTQNGGNQWLPASSGGSTYYTSNNIGDSTVYFAGLLSMKVTHDRGNSWVSSFTSFDNISSINFISEDTIIFSAYGNTAEPGGFIYRTTDGATNCTITSVGPAFPLYDLKFYDRSLGAAVGVNTIDSTGVLFVTEDGGVTWNKIQTDFISEFYSILFVGDSVALIGGTNGILVRWNWKQYLSTESFTKEESIFLSPNPTSESLSLKFPASEFSIRFELIDLLGRRCITETFPKGSVSASLDISSLKTGMYLCILYSGSHTVLHQKLVKL